MRKSTTPRTVTAPSSTLIVASPVTIVAATLGSGTTGWPGLFVIAGFEDAED